MDAIRAAAQFAAFVWHDEVLHDSRRSRQHNQAAAARFAQANWQSFMPLAQEGLGRLLLRIAERRGSRSRRLTLAS